MPGEPVQLTDPKGRSHLITLRVGASFHTHRGILSHDDIIGGPDGNVVRSQGGTPYVVFRPLLADFTLAMKRGAAVVYPKDAAQIVAFADVFPGARVLEAGAGSGALSCWLLRAVGDQGTLVSFERRPDFAEIARRNVEQFFGGAPPAWQLVNGEFSPDGLADFDRVILDMLAPWDCLDAVSQAELEQHVLHVRPDGGLAEVEPGSDFGVGQSAGHQLEDQAGLDAFWSLQKVHGLVLRGIVLAVADSRSGAHPLHVPRSYQRACSCAVFMRHSAFQHVGDDFHVAVRMSRESAARINSIFVNDS